MASWNPELLDKYIAQGLSTFVDACVPDISEEFPQAEHWVQNLFLNSLFRGTGFRDPIRQLVIAFLRRASHAYSTYTSARSLTLSYLDGNDVTNPRIGRYYGAVAEWEVLAVDVVMATELLNRLNSGTRLFLKGDGSIEHRVYEMGNCVKHVAGRASAFSEGATLPLWITSEGLKTHSYSASFAEVATLIRDLCSVAEKLQNPANLVTK